MQYSVATLMPGSKTIPVLLFLRLKGAIDDYRACVNMGIFRVMLLWDVYREMISRLENHCPEIYAAVREIHVIKVKPKVLLDKPVDINRMRIEY